MTLQSRSKFKPKSVVWRMTEKTHRMYVAYYHALINAEPFSEGYHEALDGLQSLPGFPLGYGGHSEDRHLQPEIIDAPTVSVH